MIPAIPTGGVVRGIGCDLIEITRMEEVIRRQGDAFLERVFTEEERRYCSQQAHPPLHFAARWAAKEAVAKCFATGIGAELGWKSVAVRHGDRAEPLVVLDPQGEDLLRHCRATSILLSLSHTDSLALAVAVLLDGSGTRAPF